MIRHLIILAALLSGGVAHAADQATPPLSFVAGKLQVSSADSGFLATGSSLSCSSSPGKLIIDSTADTLAWCSSGGSTVKQAALGNDNGEATGIAPLTVDAGDIQSGVIPPSKMTESFMQSYAGTGLAFDTTTSPDSLKIAADGVALGANTTGSYVATISGTSNEVSVSGSGSETAVVTVGLPSTIDLGGKTSFEVPNSSGPTTNAFGMIAGDNDAWAASRGAPQWYDGTTNTYLVGVLAADAPSHWQVPRWNAGGTVTWENGDRAVTAASLGLHCAYSANDTATLRSALETGGAAAGKTLFLPSGCKILLGSPGAGDSVADLASDTTIECEDETAGFVLARKSCSDSSETPGAACTADNQCRSGTCDPDYPAGTAFAPTEGSTYTVLGAAAGTTNLAIKRCGIWVNGGSGDSTAMGGAGKRWGYCDGSGGSDVTGEGCYNACDSSSLEFEGFACNANSDCNVGGAGTPGSCTARAGGCKAGGGSCVAIPYATNWGASGPGKIHPIAWSSATNARVEGVTIYDHRRGDYSIWVGTGGQVSGSTNTGDTLTTNQAAGQIYGPTLYDGGIRGCSTSDRCLTPTVNIGVVADGEGSRVSTTTAYGWSAGINAKNAATVENSTGGGYGAPDVTGWNGNTDLLISGPGVTVDGFRGGAGLYCILPEYGSGYNFIVQRAFCDGNIGPKFIIQGAGNQYSAVRGAWSGRGVVGLGDQRGRCSAGTRSGKVCIFEAGTDATIGCPSSSCAAHADFPAGNATHFTFGGGSLLHTDVANVAYVRAPTGKRCSDTGGPCSVDGDCASTQCRPLRFTEGLFSNVMFFKGGSGQTAIDLTASSIGVSQNSVALGGGPSINGWLVEMDAVGGFASGIKFPTLARICVGGSNAGASCTADSTCTGGGACRGPVEKFTAHGNVDGVTTPLTNWSWAYGDVSGLSGLLSTDDQGGVVTFTAGEALSRGQLVKLSTTANQVVKVATTDTGEQAVGVVLADTLSGYPVRVMRTGTAACITDTGTIAAGDLLERGTTTDGRVQTSNASSDNIIGTAMEADGSTGTTFRCAVRPPGVQSAAATPFQTQFLTADAATQTADTVVNTQFTFTLSANKTYILDGALIVSGGSTGDMRCNLDGPASMTTVLHGYNNGTTMTVSGDNTDGKCVDIVAGSDNVVNVGGLVVTGASGGSLDWKWAQNVSNGVGTTVKAGSWMRIMER